ncbi:iron-containing alcohol dehydrogenase [Sulfodiicoccus acidiphilus]|uniref:iron-containing alcohol dehydrogenase n=1 Tax=Sulfodiicoccus acidiphilus TaxID=1670455 RepID=UPI000F84B393|nr:iron-containing alcohol dehydrogenase [Sulfodiicoccus acidiphilus]
MTQPPYLRPPYTSLLATGLRALDHNIEAYYSTMAQPFVDLLVEGSFRRLMDNLSKLPASAVVVYRLVA